MALSLLHGRESVGINRRWTVAQRSPAAHAAEDQQVKEMHSAQDQQHSADFNGQSLNAFLGRNDLVTELQRQTDKAEIDEIEAHYQQVIDGISQRFVAMKDIDQKDAAVFVQRVRDPDGERNADGQVNQISCDFESHNGPPWKLN